MKISDMFNKLRALGLNVDGDGYQLDHPFGDPSPSLRPCSWIRSRRAELIGLEADRIRRENPGMSYAGVYCAARRAADETIRHIEAEDARRIGMLFGEA